MTIVLILILILLAILAMYDFFTLILPDFLLIPTGILVLMYVSFNSGYSMKMIADFLVPPALLIFVAFIIKWFKKKDVLGWGDIKLSAVIGLWLGMEKFFFSLFLSALVALIVLIILVLLKKKKLHDPIPFGFYLILSSVVWSLW